MLEEIQHRDKFMLREEKRITKRINDMTKLIED